MLYLSVLPWLQDLDSEPRSPPPPPGRPISLSHLLMFCKWFCAYASMRKHPQALPQVHRF